MNDKIAEMKQEDVMTRPINERNGNKSLFNLIPITDNILVEVEFKHTALELSTDIRDVAGVRVVGVGNNVTELVIGDYINVKPNGLPLYVISPRIDCRYYMFNKYEVTGIFTERTPLKNISNITIEHTAPGMKH